MSVHSICSCVVLSCSAISSLLHCWKRTWENHHNMMHVICAATSTHITATAVSRGAQQVSIKSSSSVKNLYFTGTPSGRVRERAALLLNSSSYMSELASCCARLTCTGAISSKASSSRCFDNWTILSQVQVLMWGLFSLYYILINISIYFFFVFTAGCKQQAMWRHHLGRNWGGEDNKLYPYLSITSAFSLKSSVMHL